MQPRPQGPPREGNGRALGTRLVRVNTQRRTDTPTLKVERFIGSPKTELRPRRIDEGPCFYPLLAEPPSLSPLSPAENLFLFPRFQLGRVGRVKVALQAGYHVSEPIRNFNEFYMQVTGHLPTSQIFLQFLSSTVYTRNCKHGSGSRVSLEVMVCETG